MDVKTPPVPVVRTGGGERGSVSASGIEGRGRAIKPSPPDSPLQRVMDDWVLLAAWVCETGHSITDWIGGLFHQYRSLIGIEIGRQKTDQAR